MRRILMTGCSSGFGKTVREKLMDDGHYVFGLGVGGPDMEIDFTSDHLNIMEDVIIRQGPFDTLINNAGLMEIAPLYDYSLTQMERSINVNLMAPFCLMRAFYARNYNKTPPKGGFRIVNTSSMSIKIPSRNCCGYVATKAALEAMTRSLSRELAGSPFIFCSICPNSVENTEMMSKGFRSLVNDRHMSVEDARKYMTPPIGRMITHEEMYSLIKFAIMDMPESMTGATLTMPAGTGL